MSVVDIEARQRFAVGYEQRFHVSLRDQDWEAYQRLAEQFGLDYAVHTFAEAQAFFEQVTKALAASLQQAAPRWKFFGTV